MPLPVASDARPCVVTWIKHLAGLQPENLDDPNRFLSDGKVPSRDKVFKFLKEAAGGAKGTDEDEGGRVVGGIEV